MNILKLTESGIVVITKVGISPELSDKVLNKGSYYIQTITEDCDKIASCEVCDNDIDTCNEKYPKMVKITSVPFDEVDADCVSAFAKTQQNLLTEVLEAEAANLKIERASDFTNRVFKTMLDTSFESPENEEN